MSRRFLAALLAMLLLAAPAAASPEDFGDDGFTRPAGPPPRASSKPGARPQPIQSPRNPMPARIAPAPPRPGASAVPVPMGPWQRTQVSVVAAGRHFRLKGLYFEDRKVSMLEVGDPALASLFTLYGAALRWDGTHCAVVVTREQKSLPIAEGATQMEKADGTTVRIDTPVCRIDGSVWLPVGSLPHVLPGALQGLGRGKYAFDPLVSDVSIEDMAGGGAQIIIASAVPMRWKTVMLKRPNRYVLDLPNAVLDLERYKQVEKRLVEHPQIGRIRFDQFSFKPNVVRVVIPLGENQELHVLPRSTPTHLAVAIGQRAAQPHAEDFSQQQITDMRVEREKGLVRVTLIGSGPFQYAWHRLKEPDNRFFLDISQAVLAGPRRVVDLDGSKVDGVRLGQYQTEPVPTVRLLLEMDQPADTRVYPSKDAPNALVIEVREGRSGPDDQGYGATHMPKARGVVCIDAGHGGSDPGAWNPALRIYEKDVTLDVSRRLAEVLRAQGWTVVMTRTTDRDVSWAGSSANEELGARVKVARDFKADLFVSIHCNASKNRGVSGTSMHWYKSTDRGLAGSIHPHVVGALGTVSRGLIRNSFYVLRHTRMPAVLIETAFITHSGDGRKLADPDYRQKLATGIAQGLTVYLARTGARKASQR